MQLYEKLEFLMGLTQTSNRMLAQELRVDPSLISRLRTGARGLPRNREYIRAMACCFAKRCSAEYQRIALSEMLRIKQTLTIKWEQLTEILYYWLCGERDEVGRFIQSFQSAEIESTSNAIPVEPGRVNAANTLYYSNEGKRAAARAVYRHLLTVNTPGQLYISSDEAGEWIVEDYEFSGNLQRWGLDLLKRGFQLYQIAPPTTDVDQAFESLTRWLPIYMTGKADAFFYPRMRDNVHRRTLVIAPGEIAMISNSIGCHPSSSATLVTTDGRLIEAYGGEFREYLSLCHPMMNTCTSLEDRMQCITQFLAAGGSRIQEAGYLSIETAPSDVMAYCMDKLHDSNRETLYNLYFIEMNLFKKCLERYELIEIVPLASITDVREGRVQIALSCGEDTTAVFYTPELYISHLKSILFFMETYQNYHFIPVTEKAEYDVTLMVRENQKALLVRNTPSLAMFEIAQPDMVQLCQEHLFRVADRIGYRGANRSRIITQIREHIHELQTSR